MNKKTLNISRKTADRIVSEVIERAKEINASSFPKFMLSVKKIAVFGSYLTDKEKLGDVDIAVLWERRKECEKGDWHTNALKCIEIHKKSVPDWFQQFDFPHMIVRQTLRNRSKSLSIHAYDELERMAKEWDTKYKVIYEKP